MEVLDQNGCISHVKVFTFHKVFLNVGLGALRDHPNVVECGKRMKEMAELTGSRY